MFAHYFNVSCHCLMQFFETLCFCKLSLFKLPKTAESEKKGGEKGNHHKAKELTFSLYSNSEELSNQLGIQSKWDI